MPYKEHRDHLEACRRYDQQRRKTHQCFKITLPREDAERLTRYAKREGVSTARLIAERSLHGLDDTLYLPRYLTDGIRKMTVLLSRTASNVNQIAYTTHLRTKGHSMPIEVRQTLQDILLEQRELKQTVQKEITRLWKCILPQ